MSSPPAHDPDGPRPGDKARIRCGDCAGERGIITSVGADRIKIEIHDGRLLEAASCDVTNYSLAARRAWQVMPKRAGRPSSSPTGRKKMVSLRLRIELWEQLGAAVASGLIPSREEAVNNWIEEKINEILTLKSVSDESEPNHENTR